MKLLIYAFLLVSLLFVNQSTFALSYIDPDASDPNQTMLINGDIIALVPVPFLSDGVAKVKTWVFTVDNEPGYFYAYQIINETAASGVGNAAALTYFGLADLMPHTVLGNGAGKGAGATYLAWSDGGDAANAEWFGGSTKSIKQGATSPDPLDTVDMFEIHSNYGPGKVPITATASGGGYTGQSREVWGPVPEPSAMLALGTGFATMFALIRKRK